MNAAALRRVRAALRERWQEAVSTAVVAALCLFAHRGLLVFDPYALTALGPSDAGEIFFAPEAGTPGVVLALVAVVISVRLARIDARTPSYASTAGSGVLLLFGSGLCVWGAATTSSFVLAMALASVTLGLGGWLFGSAGHRTLWIPALMLLLAAPMPPNLVNPVIYPLQLATTNAAAILLSGIGYPTVVAGDLIRVAGRTVEVIESCSGYRAIGTLAVAALFYAGVIPRRTARTLLLLGAAPLVAFSVNAVRVASLALDPESNIEEVHLVQGLLVFGAGSLALGGIDRLLGRLLPEPDSAGAVTTEAGREVTAGEPVALRWGAAFSHSSPSRRGASSPGSPSHVPTGECSRFPSSSAAGARAPSPPIACSSERRDSRTRCTGATPIAVGTASTCSPFATTGCCRTRVSSRRSSSSLPGAGRSCRGGQRATASAGGPSS